MKAAGILFGIYFFLNIPGCRFETIEPDLFTDQNLLISEKQLPGDFGPYDKSITIVEPKVTFAESPDYLTLSWNYIKNAEQTVIYRTEGKWNTDAKANIIPSIDETSACSIIKIMDNSTFYFNDKSAEAGKVYYYAIKGIKQSGQGKVSYFYPGCILAPPQKVTAGIRTSKSAINIKWDKTPETAFYNIYRKGVSENSYKKIGATPYSHFENTNNSKYPPDYTTGYYYRISSVNKNGIESNLSNAAEGAILSPFALQPPTTVNATRAQYNDKIEIKWDEIDGARSYKIYRQMPDHVELILAGTTEKNYFIDENILPGKHYIYKISVINDKEIEGALSENYSNNSSNSEEYCIYDNEGYSLGILTNIELTKFSNEEQEIIVGYAKIPEKCNTISITAIKDDKQIEVGKFNSEQFIFNAINQVEIYYLSSFNNLNENLMSKIAEIKIKDGKPMILSKTAGEFYFTTDSDIQGSINFTIDSAKGVCYSIEKKEPSSSSFNNLYEKLISSDGKIEITDSDFIEFDYNFFTEMFPKLEEFQTYSDSPLLEALSVTYKVTATPIDFPEYAEVTIFSTWKMLNYKEAYFMIEAAEDIGTNKITNKDDYVKYVGAASPPDEETDPGLLSGTVNFQCDLKSMPARAEITFTYDNYSDWPDITLNGSYTTKEYILSQDPGILTDDTVTLTGPITIKRYSDYYLDKNHNFSNGNIGIEIVGVGNKTFKFHDYETSFFNTYTFTDRCPGGRNSNYPGRNSSGQYFNYDTDNESQINKSRFAVFAEQGNTLGKLIERN